MLPDWREQIRTRGMAWLRTLHPPPSPPDDKPVIHLGVGSPILGTVFSENGDMIAGFAFPDMPFPDMSKGFRLRPGCTFAWRKDGGTLLKLQWEQGKFAIPLGFGPNGDHLLLATEAATEVWNLTKGFISQELPAVGDRIVATVSAQGNNRFTLLTANGKVFRWPGHGGKWEIESLQLQDEIICADLGPSGTTWILVTAGGEAVSKSSGSEPTRTRLPEQMALPPKVFRDESGRLHADDANDGSYRCSFYGHKRGQVDITIAPMLGAKNTEVAFKYYSALFSPVMACCRVSQSVVRLSCEKIEVVSYHEDEFYRGVLHKWSIQSPAEVHRLSTPDQNCSAVALSPTGLIVAIGLTNGKVLLLQTREPDHCAELSPHSTPITSLTYSPDGEFLASSSKDTYVQAAREGRGQIHLHIGEPAATACSADGQYFASADQSRRIIIWNAETGSPLHVLVPYTSWITELITSSFGHQGNITALAFVAPSNVLISVGKDECFWQWDPKTGEPIGMESLESCMEVWPPTIHAAFSRNNSTVALMGASGEVGVWSLSGIVEKIYTCSSPFEDPQALAISSDGNMLAVCAGDQIHLISLPTGKSTAIPTPKGGSSKKSVGKCEPV